MKKFDLTIDPYRLDEEWVEQPEKYREVAEMTALARKEWDEAKAQLELTKAELADAIRANPEKYGLGKVTEAALTAKVIQQSAHVDAMDEVIDKRHAMDVLQGALAAMDHRKTALSKLVDLHLASYFSKPKASEGAKEQMDEAEKHAVRGKVRRRLNVKDE